MSILYLNGEHIYQCFASGAIEVIKNKKSLNSINVFPVADGDTGSNLASTMNFIMEEAKIMDSARNTMSSIADAALLGARGNSGIIMAQYINGIFMNLKDDDEISMTGFAESVKRAFSYAYSAISNPVEGTIITVIRDWSDAVYNHKDEAKNFYDLLRQPLDTALVSLKKTTSMMLILEKSKVVDSGAKGFVHFIQGFTEFLKTGKIQELEMSDDKDLPINTHLAHDLSHIDYRFCTEALISKKDKTINLETLKLELKNLGDSLIVAGNHNKARVHIHTNRPQDVINILRKTSTILFQKAEDMKRQYQIAHEKKYEIALVTDSIADLPRDILDKYQVHVVPLNIIIDNSSYLDKVTMTTDIMYGLIDELDEYPSTAQPSPKTVENLYAFLLNHYEKIIVITVAKEQSGTNNVFKMQAEKINSVLKRIEVIDSKQNSGAEGLLVMKAAELIESGTSFQNIISEINKLRDQTKILVSVNTLKYMVRSGRITKLSGVAGKLLNLKPVVSLDENGRGKIEDKAFSLNSNTKKIMNIVKKSHQRNEITRYAILHANNDARAEKFRKKVVDILKKEPEYIMNISPIVGMSAGVGSVAVAYMSEKEKKDD